MRRAAQIVPRRRFATFGSVAPPPANNSQAAERTSSAVSETHSEKDSPPLSNFPRISTTKNDKFPPTHSTFSILNSFLKKEETDLCGAPFFLPQPVASALHALSLSRRPLLLAHPHPGAPSLFAEIASNLAHKFHAELSIIDFRSILDAAAKTKIEKQLPLPIDDFEPSASFEPADYSPADPTKIEEDSHEEFEENSLQESSEEFEEDSSDEFPSVVHHHHHVHVESGKPNLRIRFNNPENNPKGNSGNASSIFNLFQSDSDESFPTDTLYNSRISSTALAATINAIKQEIVSKFANKPKSVAPQLIVLVPDATDMLLAENNSATAAFFLICNLVKSLRAEHKINILLIAGCAPSIAFKPNTQKPPAFYTDLFLGKTILADQKSQSDEWDFSKLFETPLDNLSNEFEKIQILPPSSLSVSMHKWSQKLARSKKRIPVAMSQEQFDASAQIHSHVNTLHEKMHLLIRSTNWKSIESTCAARNIRIANMDSHFFLSTTSIPPRKLSPQLKSFVMRLDEFVWPTMQIERLVSLAHGLHLHNSIKPCQEFAEDSVVEIGPQQFVEALRIMDDIDRARNYRDNPSEQTVSAESVSGESDQQKQSDSAKVSEMLKTADASTNSNIDSFETQKVSAPPKVSAINAAAPIITPHDAPSSDPTQIKEMLQKQGHKLNAHEKRLLSTVIDPHQIPVTFSDIILPAPTKLSLQTIVTLPMLRPDLFSTGILSRSTINGVLLFGPPGTGKTMLAKAVAKTSGARFMNVSLSNIFDKYVGEGEKNVKSIFTLARKLSPCIIFLDEVDAVFGARRFDANSGTGRREIINEFMSQWDGLVSDSAMGHVMVLGATNRPFDLDDAILRRMPRRLLIDVPPLDARIRILERLLRDDVMDTASITVSDLAARTHLYTGSDLKNMCVSASMNRIKEHIVRDMMLRDSSNTPISDDDVWKRIQSIDDWQSFLDSNSQKQTSSNIPPLNRRHFDAALREIPSSVTDDMQSLVELRKWDALYGDSGATRKKGVNVWGFGQPNSGRATQMETGRDASTDAQVCAIKNDGRKE